MPEHEAIATTKRKFYKALDNITNPPANPTTARGEHLAKRARRSLSGSSSVVSRESRTRNATASTANRASKAATSPPKPIPNFSPWSHETFVERLRSFSRISLWHPKPEAVGEVQWAKRGWVCVDVNTVACKGGCEKRVVVSLDAPKRAHDGDDAPDADQIDDDGTYEDALVERYNQLIVDGHAMTCLWRKAGCKDDIYHMQVVRPSIWQPELSKRCRSLQQIDKSIKDVKVQTLPRDASAITTERLIEELPANILAGLGEGDATLSSRTKAFDIALHGWHGASESGNDLLRCEACFQRIGLWMYQPGYRPGHASEEDADEDMIINLLEMHRDHCPWRNPDSQKASGSLAGLNAAQILYRVVATYAREQRRRSEEQQRNGQGPVDHDGEGEENATPASPAVSLSRDEIERQDKERDTRLQKLKRLFTIKRKSAPPGTLRPLVPPTTSTSTLRSRLGHRLSKS
ncbi:zf-C3HC-domain-containing protein [Teratosphaeria nubilosa]|uniref:Zf-C3HC-domain-containing protein n=1 Tax=Teratosphaeria nubilosa TaxID=161662 RepID=A0A6G1KZB2_9PEZI|nr:zf-C3HC-domain-containing protein [Teratosphaeria nubilosa]